MITDYKDPEEIVTLTFDFTKDLGVATINAASQVLAVTVTKNVDAGANATLNGAAVIFGNKVLQSMKLGLNDCDYHYTCRIDASDGQRLKLALTVPVRNA